MAGGGGGPEGRGAAGAVTEAPAAACPSAPRPGGPAGWAPGKPDFRPESSFRHFLAGTTPGRGGRGRTGPPRGGGCGRGAGCGHLARTSMDVGTGRGSHLHLAAGALRRGGVDGHPARSSPAPRPRPPADPSRTNTAPCGAGSGPGSCLRELWLRGHDTDNNTAGLDHRQGRAGLHPPPRPARSTPSTARRRYRTRDQTFNYLPGRALCLRMSLSLLSSSSAAASSLLTRGVARLNAWVTGIL